MFRPNDAIVSLALAFTAMAASCEEAAFCPERPGQTTPTCVMSPGATMYESGLASWSRRSDVGIRSEQWILGDHLLRHGLSRDTELQFGWRMLGKTTGLATHPGDVTVGLLHNFSGSEGPVALQFFVSLPTGTSPIGAGGSGAGARLPVALELGADWSLGLTPEIDAVGNASGHGRHLATGGAIGVGRSLAASLSASLDISVMQDHDPSRHSTSAVTSLTFAWQSGHDTQWDLGLGTGLNRTSLDRQVYIGYAHRFLR